MIHLTQFARRLIAGMVSLLATCALAPAKGDATWDKTGTSQGRMQWSDAQNLSYAGFVTRDGRKEERDIFSPRPYVGHLRTSFIDNQRMHADSELADDPAPRAHMPVIYHIFPEIGAFRRSPPRLRPWSGRLRPAVWSLLT